MMTTVVSDEMKNELIENMKNNYPLNQVTFEIVDVQYYPKSSFFTRLIGKRPVASVKVALYFGCDGKDPKALFLVGSTDRFMYVGESVSVSTKQILSDWKLTFT